MHVLVLALGTAASASPQVVILALAVLWQCTLRVKVQTLLLCT
jgi:hypothetical protein